MKYDEREKNCNLLIRNFDPTEKQQQQKTRIFQHPPPLSSFQPPPNSWQQPEHY